MRAIMISVKPEYVEKILNGEKIGELRTTIPKCELPFKVYLYCTKCKDKKRYSDEVDILKTKKFDTQKDFALEVKDKQFSAFYFDWNKDKSITPRQWFWEHDNNKIKEWLKCLLLP